MHIKNSNIQGRSPNVKSDFPKYKELLIKERICSQKILSYKRSSYFEKERNWREPLLDPGLSPFDVGSLLAF